MVFVDGENLAIRYRSALGDRQPAQHVVHEPDVFVWSAIANIPPNVVEVIRTYYYTCVGEDEVRRRNIEERLKQLGVQAPRVFSKVKGKKSKRVDISLATDMLTHAHRDNYDLAILVAGDEDYVPLVEAVMSEGKREAIWFFEDGLSRALRQAADHYFPVGEIFLQPTSDLMYMHL